MVNEQMCGALGLEGVPTATRFKTFHGQDPVLKITSLVHRISNRWETCI